MKSTFRRSAVAFLIVAVFLIPVREQEASQGVSSPKPQSQRADKTAAHTKPQEQLVRETYEKLTAYNVAAAQWNSGGESPVGEDSVLKFVLRDFRTGPITDILNTTFRDLVSPPSGEVIQVVRVTVNINDERGRGEDQTAFEAEWVNGQYSSGRDPRWTVGEVFRFMSAEFYDVGQYASYEVVVSLAGKTRSYRALALFHNAHGSAERLKPQFLDEVVGRVNDVWAEKAPAFEWKRKPSTGAPTTTPPDGRVALASESYAADADGAVEAADGVGSNYVSGTSPVWLDQGYEEHASGSHFATARFTPECAAIPDNRQRCSVQVTEEAYGDTGVLENWFYTHRGSIDKKTSTNYGPRGTEITCESAVGVAFSSCLFSCTVSIGIGFTVYGVNAKAEARGGSLWNRAGAVGNRCRIESTVSTGGCTAQGFDGSCPYGTYPDGFGSCCTGGGGACGDLGFGFGFASFEIASDGGEAVSPYRPEGGGGGGCGCDGVERMSCYAAGGEWTEATCSCYSPVLIDVAGDGLRMTDGAGGVLFDFTGDGSPEVMSWTEAGSDDSWLALDRNGNGRVDDGRELFGTSTPQPAPAAGQQRNGFTALSVYDRAGNGGNADGKIDREDSVFASLRLWQDTNHNGLSEPSELHTLASLGVASVHLNYKESKRADEFGNRFRYRAKVDDARGEKVGRWAWDVFPVKPR